MNYGQSTTAVLVESTDILVAYIHPISELCIYGPVFESVLKVLRRVKVLALLHFVVAQMPERNLVEAAGERGWRNCVVV
jgi:hypothetical protein